LRYDRQPELAVFVSLALALYLFPPEVFANYLREETFEVAEYENASGISRISRRIYLETVKDGYFENPGSEVDIFNPDLPIAHVSLFYGCENRRR